MPELLLQMRESAKQMRPVRLGSRDFIFALIHPQQIDNMKLSVRENYKIKSRSQRLKNRLAKEKVSLESFGDNTYLIGLNAN